MAKLIKELLETDGRTYEEAAKVIGVGVQTFRNKISQKSFSMKQICAMADAFGWEITITIPERVIPERVEVIPERKIESKTIRVNDGESEKNFECYDDIDDMIKLLDNL